VFFDVEPNIVIFYQIVNCTIRNKTISQILTFTWLGMFSDQGLLLERQEDSTNLGYCITAHSALLVIEGSAK